MAVHDEARKRYAERIEAARLRAHGRWTEILATGGVDARILQHRNGPCPLCGGTDRFQYTDKFGEGNYHCRQCGAGGGFKLLQAVTGVDFNTVLRTVEHCLGGLPAARPVPAPPGDRMQKLVQRIWDQAQPVRAGDPVDRYLRARGLALAAYPTVLRHHPALGYYQKDGEGKTRKLSEHPAMLAMVQAPDGSGITLHRTYLGDGEKLPAEDAKKVLSAGISGAAIRLFEPTEALAICEGIETALAVHLATGQAVWAGVSAGNLERLWLPDRVRRIAIYADNDAGKDYAGQYHAYALARRLKREEKATGSREVRVHVPRLAGQDWADVWLQRLNAKVGAARTGGQNEV